MARVLVSMPEDFLGKIDKVAMSENRTRSELIREALRSYIRKNSMSTLNEKAIYQAKELEKILG
ncbi:MAG: ribbon-helix-helix domain-containing protein [Candidatus Gastranaerophilales bacterium]|nr:ribbon-helix-helix domain-containing protein [Candidatus Gastranaerophilales bacterium]